MKTMYLLLLCSLTVLFVSKKGFTQATAGDRLLDHVIPVGEMKHFALNFHITDVDGKEILVGTKHQDSLDYWRNLKKYVNPQLSSEEKVAVDSVKQNGFTAGMLRYMFIHDEVEYLPVDGLYITTVGIRSDGTLFSFRRLGRKNEWVAYKRMPSGKKVYILSCGEGGCGNYVPDVEEPKVTEKVVTRDSLITKTVTKDSTVIVPVDSLVYVPQYYDSTRWHDSIYWVQQNLPQQPYFMQQPMYYPPISPPMGGGCCGGSTVINKNNGNTKIVSIDNSDHSINYFTYNNPPGKDHHDTITIHKTDTVYVEKDGHGDPPDTVDTHTHIPDSLGHDTYTDGKDTTTGGRYAGNGQRRAEDTKEKDKVKQAARPGDFLENKTLFSEAEKPKETMQPTLSPTSSVKGGGVIAGKAVVGQPVEAKTYAQELQANLSKAQTVTGNVVSGGMQYSGDVKSTTTTMATGGVVNKPSTSTSAVPTGTTSTIVRTENLNVSTPAKSGGAVQYSSGNVVNQSITSVKQEQVKGSIMSGTNVASGTSQTSGKIVMQGAGITSGAVITTMTSAVKTEMSQQTPIQLSHSGNVQSLGGSTPIGMTGASQPAMQATGVVSMTGALSTGVIGMTSNSAGTNMVNMSGSTANVGVMRTQTGMVNMSSPSMQSPSMSSATAPSMQMQMSQPQQSPAMRMGRQ